MIPVLCYGTETWALPKTQAMKLKKTLRAMEQIIVGMNKIEKNSLQFGSYLGPDRLVLGSNFHNSLIMNFLHV